MLMIAKRPGIQDADDGPDATKLAAEKMTQFDFDEHLIGILRQIDPTYRLFRQEETTHSLNGAHDDSSAIDRCPFARLYHCACWHNSRLQ